MIAAPKALSQLEPGAAPQGSDCPDNQALKARFNRASIFRGRVNRAFSAGESFVS